MNRPPPPPPDPPAAVLAARCAAIRAGWSEDVEKARRVGGVPRDVEVRVVRLAKVRGYRPDRGPLNRNRWEADDEW